MGSRQYVRLKMRKASGATGTPNITFTKGTDSDYLMYWGTERWNGSAIFITNVAVGGFRVNQLRDKYLNDVIDRQPDLLVYQVPLTNEYSDYRATTQTILNNVHDFIWGDRSGATTTNCLKNHTSDWADFEVLCLIPHWRYEYVSDNKFIRNYLTDADESAFIVWQRVKKLFLDHNDVPFIDIGQQMKAEAFARGWTLAESYTGTDNDSLDSFTRDTVHQNDLGGTMWAKCIAPVLDVRNL